MATTKREPVPLVREDTPPRDRAAFEAVLRELAALDDEARTRVLRAAAVFYGVRIDEEG